ncbi:MAG: general secretion pathway protein GspE [Rhodopirellula sp.]|nr:general secretion pathway protein GspE [Rhodopirellula sp.]
MELDVYKDWLGIPDGPRPPDQYELLRLVRFEDATDKVRANYKKLNAHVRKYATGQYSVISQNLLNELAKAMLCLTDPERKREYDESLGRVFEEDESSAVPMERVLVKQGHIDRDQMKEALEFAESHGLSMRDAVVQMKLVDDQISTQAFATELGVPYVDLDDMAPEFRILKRLPQPVARRNTILPLFIDDDVLLVACADEITHELEDELRLRFNLPVRRVLATPRGITEGIARYYGEMDEMIAAEDAAGIVSESSSSSKAAGQKGPAKKVQKKKQSGVQAFSQLSKDEQLERKNLGKLFMLWSVIGSVLIDQFVVKAMIVSLNQGIFGFLPSITTLIVPPIVIGYVLKVYWK